MINARAATIMMPKGERGSLITWSPACAKKGVTCHVLQALPLRPMWAMGQRTTCMTSPFSRLEKGPS